jgi:hypothetical protein
MEQNIVTIFVPTDKHYTVNRVMFRGGRYTHDASGLAWWYYNANPYSDNITIHIHGDVHQTYPNPEHITVEFEDNGVMSEKHHMSIDPGNGLFYSQPIVGRIKKKQSKKKQSKKKQSKKKQSKKKQSTKHSQKKSTKQKRKFK